MESAGFLLFMLLGWVLLAYGTRVAILCAKRSTLPRRSLYIMLGGIILLAMLFRGLYQAYWLDEGLFLAAAAGRTAEVNALLSAGANPDSAWEDGTTAINVAKRNGHKEIVLILRNAGAKQ